LIRLGCHHPQQIVAAIAETPDQLIYGLDHVIVRNGHVLELAPPAGKKVVCLINKLDMEPLGSVQIAGAHALYVGAMESTDEMQFLLTNVDGVAGHHGADGVNGANGTACMPGSAGGSATPGTNGASPPSFGGMNINIGQAAQDLVIRFKGGNGGAGGDGGNGGTGGMAGSCTGHQIMAGGQGGNGGNGGNGGDAARCAPIYISYVTAPVSATFADIPVPGRGGRGGQGGAGGTGYPHGDNGANGASGKNGKDFQLPSIYAHKVEST
jgi:hypothetical protein